MITEPTQPTAQIEMDTAAASADPLIVKMKAIEARAIERSRQRRAQEAQESLPFSSEARTKPTAPEPTAQPIQFPQWPDNRRAAVNAIFRSALFPVLNNKQPRRYLEEERLCSVDGIEVYFTGKQFDQSDLDVYLELLHVARETPFGVECYFSAYGMLKRLGRATGKSNHRWLHSVLIRLCTGTVDMTDHKIRYFGHLVESGIKDEITKHYAISINPKFSIFFNANHWASLDSQQRRDLKRNQTAKALHAYYSTHAAPCPHRYETLARLIGLKNITNSRKVKADLVKAHEALKKVGFLADFEARANTIAPKVNHTPSQNRHIVRKIIGSRKPRR